MEKIKFETEDGTSVEFYLEEQTKIGGISYLLVSDTQEEAGNAYVLKDVSEGDGQEACYVMVEESEELEAVFKVFQQMLEDVDLCM